MQLTAAAISTELAALGSAEIATHSQRFFKTGKGQYGEGDRFIGIRVPVLRKQVRRFREAPMRTLLALLKSPWHEERLFAVLSLVDRYGRGDVALKKEIFDLYLQHAEYVNNWDLVDCSAHLIVGPWLESRSRRRLKVLARSDNLWRRRIAIMATYHFIRQLDYVDTLAVAEILLHDPHDLIHKAVGWMLREIGNRDKHAEVEFLMTCYKRMPRTMLRYAIEKFPEAERQAWLKGSM